MEQRYAAQCSGPAADWQSERPGPCKEPIDPASKAWCTTHERERRAYFSRRFKELGGLVGRLKQTEARSPKGRRAWIRNQFALLNKESRSGYPELTSEGKVKCADGGGQTAEPDHSPSTDERDLPAQPS